jgi:CheY-like chemotaxis protein
METDTLFQEVDSTRILLVGNNPLELSHIVDMIAQIPGQRFITEIAFDTRSLWSRLMKFSPGFIIIDDNVGKIELNQTIHALTHHAKTSDIPIAVLKNSNYTEALASADIWDYLLKDNLTSSSLLTALRNTLKFKRTRQYLQQALDNRKNLLLKIAG